MSVSPAMISILGLAGKIERANAALQTSQAEKDKLQAIIGRAPAEPAQR